MHAGAATAALGELEKLRAATLDSLNSPSPSPALAARGSDAREAAELREQLAAAEAALRAAQAQAAQPNGACAYVCFDRLLCRLVKMDIHNDHLCLNVSMGVHVETGLLGATWRLLSVHRVPRRLLADTIWLVPRRQCRNSNWPWWAWPRSIWFSC